MNWRRRHSNRSSTTCHFVCFWAKISRAPASEYNNDFGTLLDVVVVSIRTISIYYYWNVVKLTHTHSPLCGSVGHSIWKGCNRTQPKRIHMSNISASLVRALSPLLHRTIVCMCVCIQLSHTFQPYESRHRIIRKSNYICNAKANNNKNRRVIHTTFECSFHFHFALNSKNSIPLETHHTEMCVIWSICNWFYSSTYVKCIWIHILLLHQQMLKPSPCQLHISNYGIDVYASGKGSNPKI